MLPPKLKHILGCLAFSEKNFAKNKTLPRPNHFLKIQWEIHFFTFLNTDRNGPKQNFEQQLYSTLLENCFQNRFRTTGSVRTRKHALSLSCIFWLGHFPKSKNSFESSFLIKCYIITVLKKNLER